MKTIIRTLFTACGLFALLPLLTSCGKDTEPNRNNPDTPQPQQKHNVELVYGKLPSTQWQNISFDTLNKYNSDPTVDTIFMIPEMSNQYSTFTTTQLQTLVNKLRERHNVNPNKVFGKGELQLKDESVAGHPEILKFFADTLKYTVTYHSQAKSR